VYRASLFFATQPDPVNLDEPHLSTARPINDPFRVAAAMRSGKPRIVENLCIPQQVPPIHHLWVVCMT
jgi:hypothetical protein